MTKYMNIIEEKYKEDITIKSRVYAMQDKGLEHAIIHYTNLKVRNGCKIE